MLFRLGVKKDFREFYNYEKELNEFTKALRDNVTKMVVIKGVRRTGKSSLINVGLNLTNIPSVYVDARLATVISIRSFYDMIAQGFNRLLSSTSIYKTLVDTLSKISGISVYGVSISILRRNIETVIEMFYRVNEWASKNNLVVTLVFDEAQQLYLIPGFPNLLAYIYDYMDSFKLVVAGSEVGVLDKLLGKSNRSPPTVCVGLRRSVHHGFSRPPPHPTKERVSGI